MSFFHTIVGLCFALALAGLSARAHRPKRHQNITVLSKELGKELKTGMKLLSKGLGVKCSACHVDGRWERDDKAAKAETRKFLQVTLTERDVGKKQAALAKLLESLAIKKPKSEPKIWAALDIWSRKKVANESTKKDK